MGTSSLECVGNFHFKENHMQPNTRTFPIFQRFKEFWDRNDPQYETAASEILEIARQRGVLEDDDQEKYEMTDALCYVTFYILFRSIKEDENREVILQQLLEIMDNQALILFVRLLIPISQILLEPSQVSDYERWLDGANHAA